MVTTLRSRRGDIAHYLRRALSDLGNGAAETSAALLSAVTAGVAEYEMTGGVSGWIPLVSGAVGALAVLLVRLTHRVWLAPGVVEREAREDMEQLYSERVSRHESDEAKLREVQAALASQSRVIVGVTTFQHDIDSASLYVTNLSGQTDDFAAQVVGLSKHGMAPTESRIAWHLSWHGHEGKKIRLHPGEKARIDLAWMRIHTVHEVEETHAARVRGNRRLDLFVNGCVLLGSDDEMLAGAWYKEPEDAKSLGWNILIHFTAGLAERAQVECFSVRVVTGDDDSPDNCIINLSSDRPFLWIQPFQKETATPSDLSA